VTFDSGILFQKGKSNLNSSTSDALTKFAKIVVNNPTMDIAILGHADNAGSFEVNQKLSQYRAQSVAYFLKLQKYTFFTI
jgi:outer membrane protein OmpA-like peptidoglycan-associated protein